MAEYDIVMEVDTEELTEEAYKVGKFAGSVTLLVEAQVRISQPDLQYMHSSRPTLREPASATLH